MKWSGHVKNNEVLGRAEAQWKLMKVIGEGQLGFLGHESEEGEEERERWREGERG